MSSKLSKPNKPNKPNKPSQHGFSDEELEAGEYEYERRKQQEPKPKPPAKKGDLVIIESKGLSIEGTVKSIDCYLKQDDAGNLSYGIVGVELIASKDNSYHYWKPASDGGRLIKLHPMNEINVVVAGINPNSKAWMFLGEAIQDVVEQYGGELTEYSTTKYYETHRVRVNLQVSFDIRGDVDEGIEYNADFVTAVGEIDTVLSHYNGSIEYTEVTNEQHVRD
jgi:hypothetical protein